MNLTKSQFGAVSKYLADISKLVFAASVLGFFIPIGPQPVTIGAFASGLTATVVSLWLSIRLAK